MHKNEENFRAALDLFNNREYEAAASIGAHPRSAYGAGVAGALCDDVTRNRLRAIAEEFDWVQLP